MEKDQKTDKKRILVVDDDPDMCFLVAHAVKSFNSGYQVDTATGATDALKKVEQAHFDLIVTDYMMPGRTGLDLITAVSQVSPATRYVIMTAHHDTGGVRSRIDKMKVGFVSKPFMLPDIISAVQEMLAAEVIAGVEASGVGQTRSQPASIAAAQPQLNKLLHQTGVLSVVLVGADGEPVLVEGVNQPEKIAKIGVLVVNNFRMANEAALLFGDDASSLKSSYFEGKTVNIYALSIEDQYFLTVIFRPMTKPGTVWFYAKQTALELAGQLAVRDEPNSDRRDNVSKISRRFDNLLGDEKNKGAEP